MSIRSKSSTTLFQISKSTRNSIFRSSSLINKNGTSLNHLYKTSSNQLGTISHFRSYSTGGIKNTRLTQESYPYVQRDERFAKLTEQDLSYFETILQKSDIITDKDDLEFYNEDWMKKYKGTSSLVLKPRTTEQISKILKYCNLKKLAVVPQGGNTGLVGGSIPVFDEIIINVSNLNKIRSFDNVSGILVADAGCILETTDQYLADNGYIFPLDLGAKGSCHIGGNVATNAGGLRLVRYGSLHGSVLGVEVVLPDGTILNSLHSLRKDNTGYDLKQLFIGSEGTLGIITGVSILCPKRPKANNVAFLAVSSYQKVLDTFVSTRNELGEILSAFEFMDSESIKLTGNHTKLTRPITDDHPFYILIETSGSNKDHDDEKLENFLEKSLTDGLVDDGVVAQDQTQLQELWKWRETIPEASTAAGGVYKYDVSLPLPHLYSLVTAAKERLKEHGVLGDTDDYAVVDAIGYGHLGDGNLHLNVCVRRYDKKVEKILEPFIYEFIQKHKGSISAEHGLGFQKKNYIGYSKDDVSIGIMKSIKNQFDPNGILNPYKYI